MATKKPEDVIKDIEVKIRQAMGRAVSVQETDRIAKDSAKMVRVRTRLGYGVNGSDKVRLKPLSPSYVAQRQGKVAFFFKDGTVRKYKPAGAPKLHSETTPRRSNLTFTGSMLDSITGQAKRAGQFTVSLGDKVRKGEKLTDRQVAQFVTEGGRPFFAFSRAEFKQIFAQFRQSFLNQLRRVSK